MSDERELTSDEEAALRRAVKAWSEDRATVEPRRRLAQLRALQRTGGTRMESVSRWPALAVAAVVALMLTLAIVWGRKPADTPIAAHVPKETPTVAEDSGPPKVKDVPQPPQPVAPVIPETSDNDKKTGDPKKVDGDTFESTLPLAKGGEVTVHNLVGSIRMAEIDGDSVVVHARKKKLSSFGGGNTIIITGNTGGGTVIVNGKRLDAEPQASATDIEALKAVSIQVERDAEGGVQISTISKQSPPFVEVTYEIGVPRYARIGKISTSNGDIQLRGAGGEGELTTVTGSIRVSGSKGTLSASSSNGDIEFTRVPGTGRIAAVTGGVRLKDAGTVGNLSVSNGNIEIAGATSVGKLNAVTGNIRVSNAGKVADASVSNGEIAIANSALTGRLNATTGNISIKTCSGAVNASVSNGDITVDGPSTVGRLEAITGTITADVKDLAASSSISSSNGAITLRLAAGVNANLDVESTNGTITNSVPELGAVAKNDSDTHATLRGKVGDGSSHVRVRATTGDVTISRMP